MRCRERELGRGKEQFPRLVFGSTREVYSESGVGGAVRKWPNSQSDIEGRKKSFSTTAGVEIGGM